MIDALLTSVATATDAIRWTDLGLDPVALDLGFFELRWYSLAYLVGIVLGWWYLLKLLAQPGAPMAKRHADDMVFYVTLGIILGGRLGYVLFYRPLYYLENPAEIPPYLAPGAPPVLAASEVCPWLRFAARSRSRPCTATSN